MGNTGSNDGVRIASSPTEARVPEYEVFLRTEARHPYVVYILAFNERQRLAQQLDRFPKDAERGFDIMLGDDGSTDGTSGSDLLERYAVRGATRLKRNSGLSQNIKVALEWLYGQNYKGVILMNGNNGMILRPCRNSFGRSTTVMVTSKAHGFVPAENTRIPHGFAFWPFDSCTRPCSPWRA